MNTNTWTQTCSAFSHSHKMAFFLCVCICVGNSYVLGSDLKRGKEEEREREREIILVFFFFFFLEVCEDKRWSQQEIEWEDRLLRLAPMAIKHLHFSHIFLTSAWKWNEGWKFWEAASTNPKFGKHGRNRLAFFFAWPWKSMRAEEKHPNELNERTVQLSWKYWHGSKRRASWIDCSTKQPFLRLSLGEKCPVSWKYWPGSNQRAYEIDCSTNRAFCIHLLAWTVLFLSKSVITVAFCGRGFPS